MKTSDQPFTSVLFQKTDGKVYLYMWCTPLIFAKRKNILMLEINVYRKFKKWDQVLLLQSTVAVSLCNVRWVVEISRACLDFGTVTDVGMWKLRCLLCSPKSFKGENYGFTFCTKQLKAHCGTFQVACHDATREIMPLYDVKTLDAPNRHHVKYWV